MLTRAVSGLLEPATLAVFTGVLVTSYLTMSAFSKKPRLPPGPFALPIIGNLVQLMIGNSKKKAYEIFRDWSKEKYGSVMTLYMGTRRTVVLNDFEVVQEACQEKAAHFANRPEMIMADMMVMDGGSDIMMRQYGDKLHHHRKVATMALRKFASGKTLEGYIRNATRKAIQAINEENGKPFDVKPAIVSLVYCMMSSVCYGKDPDFDDPDLKSFQTLTKDFTDVMGAGFVGDYISFLKIFPDPSVKKAYKLAQPYVDYIKKNFQEHKDSYDENNLRDLCDYLIFCQHESMKEGKDERFQLNDADLYLTILDIFGAAIDTMTTTSHFAVAFATKHQDVQANIRKEVDSIVGQKEVTIEDRRNLPYTEAFMCETLRAGTAAVLGVPLATSCDTKLKGYDIPKDTMVMINIWALHNDPDYWDAPDEFRPSRFLDEEGKLAPKPASYLPFSAGRRSCLGEALAKTQLMMILPMLFQQLSFSPPDGEKFDIELEDSPLFALPKQYLVVATDRQ